MDMCVGMGDGEELGFGLGFGIGHSRDPGRPEDMELDELDHLFGEIY
jgi:hypothetical protein